MRTLNFLSVLRFTADSGVWKYNLQNVIYHPQRDLINGFCIYEKRETFYDEDGETFIRGLL